MTKLRFLLLFFPWVLAIADSGSLLLATRKSETIPVDSTEVTGFLDGPSVPTNLPENGIYPKGLRMHIGAYAAMENPSINVPGKTNLERLVEGGFTVAGPYYGWDPAKHLVTLKAASKLGLRLAIQLTEPPSIRKQSIDVRDRPALMRNLSDAEVRQYFRDWMSTFLNNPEIEPYISSWAAGPEELHPSNREEVHFLEVLADAVHSIDSKRRPIFEYQPNSRTSVGLEKISASLDFIFMGAYTSAIGWSETRGARINWAMEQILGASRTSGQVPMVGLRLSKDLPGFGADDLRAHGELSGRLHALLRHDTWLALARGAKAIQVWSMWEKRPNLSTHREQFDAYASVALELTGKDDLQTPLLFGDKRTDLSVEILSGPTRIRAHAEDLGDTDESYKGMSDGSWSSITLGNFSLRGSRVLVVVNSASEPVQAAIVGMPSTGVKCTDISGSEAHIEGLKQKRILLNMPAFGVWIGRLTK
ncbi:hypothetical protein CCP3SC1AL1_410010 [Gammaproteobacteria bacterium]